MMKAPVIEVSERCPATNIRPRSARRHAGSLGPEALFDRLKQRDQSTGLIVQIPGLRELERWSGTVVYGSARTTELRKSDIARASYPTLIQ